MRTWVSTLFYLMNYLCFVELIATFEAVSGKYAVANDEAVCAPLMDKVISETSTSPPHVIVPSAPLPPSATEVKAWSSYGWTDPRFYRKSQFQFQVFAVNTGYTGTVAPAVAFARFQERIRSPGILSVSIINETNIRMYGVYAFIVDLPADGLIAAAPHDMASWRPNYGTTEWAKEIYREYGLPDPATIYSGIAYNGYSEVLYSIDASPKAKSRQILGIVASPDLNSKTVAELKSLAEKLKIPFIVLSGPYG